MSISPNFGPVEAKLFKSLHRNRRGVGDLDQVVERDRVEDGLRNAHQDDVEEDDHGAAEHVMQRSQQPLHFADVRV